MQSSFGNCRPPLTLAAFIQTLRQEPTHEPMRIRAQRAPTCGTGLLRPNMASSQTDSILGPWLPMDVIHVTHCRRRALP